MAAATSSAITLAISSDDSTGGAAAPRARPISPMPSMRVPYPRAVALTRWHAAGMTSVAPGLRRVLEPGRVPERIEASDGYLDLLGDKDPTGGRPGQRLMVSRVLPLIYERLWRPL